MSIELDALLEPERVDNRGYSYFPRKLVGLTGQKRR